GWLHSTLVTGTLCYGVDGALVWGRHNCLSTWNGGETSRQLQEKLADLYFTVPGIGVAADSAFPVAREAIVKIVAPLKDGDVDQASAGCRLEMIALHNAITSLRQAAEWGMGSASKCYSRLLLPLPYNANKRHVRLDNIYRLYNFRVRRIRLDRS
ncbi:hypothetical protein PHYSODRAFT_533481, partial [Phytophthora sojae]